MLAGISNDSTQPIHSWTTLEVLAVDMSIVQRYKQYLHRLVDLDVDADADVNSLMVGFELRWCDVRVWILVGWC